MLQEQQTTTSSSRSESRVVVFTPVKTEIKIINQNRPILLDSLSDLSVVFPVLSANIDGLLTQLSALLEISHLKVHSWRDGKNENMINTHSLN